MTSNILRAASLVLAGICALIANPADAERSSVMKQKIDALFAKWDVAGSPGASIAVIADDRVLYLKGYGYADLEHGIRNTPETVFHIASVSKQFTGVAALIAEEEGILKIDDLISRYIPDLPPIANKITLRELLYHTSGLRDPMTLQILSGGSLEDVITEDKVMTLINRQRGLNFEPGTEHLYSNAGYILMAEALEKISGKTFANWTAAKIFQPLGMNNSRFNDDYRNIIVNSANSYVAKPDGSFGRSPLNLGMVGSSGVKTTATDMAKWAQLIIDGEKNGLRMPKAFYEPGKLSNGKPIPYGFGIFFDSYHGEKILEHGGSDSAFRAHLMTIPSKHFAVVILANTDNLPVGEFSRKIADIVLGSPSEKPVPQTDSVVEKIVDGEKYAGIYLMENGSTINVVAKPTGLVTLLNGSEIPLRLIEPDILGISGTGIKIKFLRETNAGPYTTIVLLAGEKSDTGHRSQEKEIPPALLDTIVGSYFSPEVEKFFDIYVDHGKIGSKLSTGMKVPLLYIGNNIFIEPNSGMKMVFIQENEGSAVRRAMISGFRMRNMELIKGARPGD